jgi:glutaredoxin-related protein
VLYFLFRSKFFLIYKVNIFLYYVALYFTTCEGTPKSPMCVFSVRAVKILSLCNVTDYLAINVLENEEIRQGIKDFSRWPTIPQLYINSEFWWC